MSNKLPSDSPPIGSTVSLNSSDESKKTRNASPDPAHLEKVSDPNQPPVVGQGAELVPKEVEKKLMRKLDIHIIPWAMWMYLMSFMDRVNIGNARIYGLEEDLGIAGTNQYQLAVSILFVTYCLFEAPSNSVLKRFQPARWLGVLTFCWGLVATFSAWVNNINSLIACRLLLGLFEAGLFPGLVVYLTMFYNRRNIALRTSFLYGTAALSGALGGLVAYGIGDLDGVRGWSGWRWIILINGIPTIFTGILTPWVLPNSPETASFLSEDDKRNMILLRQQEYGQTASAQHFDKRDAIRAFKDWKTWAFAIAQWSVLCMLYSFSVFLPTILQELNGVRDNNPGGWTNPQIQALTVPVYMLGAIVYISTSFYADKVQMRGPFVIVFNCIALLGYILLIANINMQASFAGCFILAIGVYTTSGFPMTWIGVNNPRYGKRAIASGLQLTVGNSSGVAAPFLFSTQFAPLYRPGYAACIGLMTMSLCIYTTLHLYFLKQNRDRKAGKQDWKMEGKTEEEIAEMGEDSPRYFFIP
ncbi:major facilitator superfamily domain-containing protein [Dendryphion nanum]|uniref:Major facilitator superfamily domain-containing protein n=1 Tax=Dendryphion nanum TaxID=256645 RepID=A0A9P9I7H5_9PLEO|nr:major facilitator superfamily domain-containing protein [Dendryphion nanum]